MKIIILGASGMLGNAFYQYFSINTEHQVFGTIRNNSSRRFFQDKYSSNLISNIDVLDQDTLTDIFSQIRPEVVINCIGLIKQHTEANDPIKALPINSLLPHRLDRLCRLCNARLVHFSTDCVFRGDRGMYSENDISDATDLYGKSKYIGELQESPNAITLRTSIIGHELAGAYALVDWFLSQSGVIKGFRKAIFSGLPTVELARVVDKYVLSEADLSGLYHVSAEPIDKMSLLQLVAKEYGKEIEITPDDAVIIDRSLDSSRFRSVTGYKPPDWPSLVKLMRESRNFIKN